MLSFGAGAHLRFGSCFEPPSHFEVIRRKKCHSYFFLFFPFTFHCAVFHWSETGFGQSRQAEATIKNMLLCFYCVKSSCLRLVCRWLETGDEQLFISMSMIRMQPSEVATTSLSDLAQSTSVMPGKSWGQRTCTNSCTYKQRGSFIPLLCVSKTRQSYTISFNNFNS